VRVGIVTNELFDPRAGRVGGFGWASRAAERRLRAAGHEPVFVSAAVGVHAERVVDGPIVVQRSNRVDLARRLRRAHVDLLLTVDYRPNYNSILAALPRTPAIVWVRDPRGPEQLDALASLRLPGDPAPPGGVDPIDCTPLALVARASRLVRRPLMLATVAPETLLSRARAAYGMPIPALPLLPNPIAGKSRPPDPDGHGRPSFVFVGRLDPVKRPWLFVDLARRIPEADFLLLGDAYVDGPGAWQPAGLPSNARLLGHVAGDDKLRLMRGAVALVNTSIHEALPVTFQESLWCETPVVACHDPERTASRFGAYVGRWDGDGTAGLDAFESALRGLLAEDVRRERLGRDGRAWIDATHTDERFDAALAELAAGLGARRVAA
jgi:glycosyltransferase involved in cell wall biosynthesis